MDFNDVVLSIERRSSCFTLDSDHEIEIKKLIVLVEITKSLKHLEELAEQ